MPSFDNYVNNSLAFTDPSGFGFGFGFGFWGSLGRWFDRNIISPVIHNPVVRIAVGVVVGVGLAIASIYCPALFGAALAWWQAALIGAGTTMGLGLVGGASFKQILFEGAAAFAATGILAHGIAAGSLTTIVSGGSGSGIGIGLERSSETMMKIIPNQHQEAVILIRVIRHRLRMLGRNALNSSQMRWQLMGQTEFHEVVV